MKCPKCEQEMKRLPRMFALRMPGGPRFFHGQVCEPCNVLYDDPEGSFKAAVAARAEARAKRYEG
jgi:hypothetical protein